MEEKWVKMQKSRIGIFWAKTHEWYRYQRVVPVPLCSGQVVPIPLKLVSAPTGSEGLVPVPLLPAALFVHIFALLSPVFVYRWLGTLRND